MDRPRFVVGYGGETEYVWKGINYRVRHHSMHSGFWAKDYFANQVAATGTIRNANSGRYHEYPPDEVCAFFPGYVPARYREDWTLEYKDDNPPVLVPDECCQPDGMVAQVYLTERDAWDAFHTELHELIHLFPSYWEYSSFRDSIDRDSPLPTAGDYERVRQKARDLADMATV